VRNTIRLYREEPIPVGKPLPNKKQVALPFSSTQRLRGESRV
jgi:hypothetical protein